MPWWTSHNQSRRTFIQGISEQSLKQLLFTHSWAWHRLGERWESITEQRTTSQTSSWAVFVISCETGKVLDYRVQSKHCAGCKYWKKKDKSSDEYKRWKDKHNDCEINFVGSSVAMEPTGILDMFRASLESNIRYTRLIADGDTKTHALVLEEQPYGSTLVEKCDCVGHVQKRMGTALRNLKHSIRVRSYLMGRRSVELEDSRIRW